MFVKDKPEDKPATTASQLTKAQAAKLVRRPVEEIKNGKTITKEVAIKPEEVFSFTEYADHIVVVTTDGRKYRGDKK